MEGDLRKPTASPHSANSNMGLLGEVVHLSDLKQRGKQSCTARFIPMISFFVVYQSKLFLPSLM